MNEILENYGLTKEYQNSLLEKGVIRDKDISSLARVTAVHKERYELITIYGEAFGRLKTKEYYKMGEEFPTVGDFVLVSLIPHSDRLILKTLPRKTFFSRRDPDTGRGEQAVAANFDYVFIMQSLNHDFNENRLIRYLMVARQSGAEPLIVLTKADLVSDFSEYIKERKMYREAQK